MAIARKNLGGGLFPSAATLTTLYTVPASTEVTVSSIVVCNQGAAQDTIRIAHRIAGAGIATTQYLYYDLPIPANDTFVLTIGITMQTTDVLSVRSTLGTCSFNAYGIEVT